MKGDTLHPKIIHAFQKHAKFCFQNARIIFQRSVPPFTLLKVCVCALHGIECFPTKKAFVDQRKISSLRSLVNSVRK